MKTISNCCITQYLDPLLRHEIFNHINIYLFTIQLIYYHISIYMIHFNIILVSSSMLFPSPLMSLRKGRREGKKVFIATHPKNKNGKVMLNSVFVLISTYLHIP